MALLFGVYRLYSGDVVLTWETEWKSSCLTISVIASIKNTEGIASIRLVPDYTIFKKVFNSNIEGTLEVSQKSEILIIFF